MNAEETSPPIVYIVGKSSIRGGQARAFGEPGLRRSRGQRRAVALREGAGVELCSAEEVDDDGAVADDVGAGRTAADGPAHLAGAAGGSRGSPRHLSQEPHAPTPRPAVRRGPRRGQRRRLSRGGAALPGSAPSGTPRWSPFAFLKRHRRDHGGGSWSSAPSARSSSTLVRERDAPLSDGDEDRSHGPFRSSQPRSQPSHRAGSTSQGPPAQGRGRRL